jgi:hypothetical protein
MHPVFIRPALPEDGSRILAMLENLASFEGAAHPPRLNLIALANDVFTPSPKLRILVAEAEAHSLLGFSLISKTIRVGKGQRECISAIYGSRRMHDRGVSERHSSVTLFLCTDRSESMSLCSETTMQEISISTLAS